MRTTLAARITAAIPLTLLALVGTARGWDRGELLQQSGHPEAMKEYASEPYVFLTKQELLRLHADKTERKTVDVVLVTGREGREQASRKLMLHKRTKLKKIECGTLGLNNQWLPLKGEPLKKQVGQFVEYTVFLESVVQGSILVFAFELEHGPSWYREFRAGDAAPVLHARFSVEEDDMVSAAVMLKNATLEPVLEGAGMRVERKTEGDPGAGEWGRVTYDFYDVPAAWKAALAPSPESYQPTCILYWDGIATESQQWNVSREILKRRNWNDMVLSEGASYFAACDISKLGDLCKIVERVAPKNAHMADKVAGILRYVRDEYQVIDGAATWEHFAAPAKDTFESRGGTGADVSALAIGMMHQAGVPLRFGFLRSKPYGPWHSTTYNSLQFDRLLPVLLVDGETVWIDTLCRECGIGDLDWRLAGTKGLVFQADIRQDMDHFWQSAFEKYKNESPADVWNAFAKQILNARWSDILEAGESPEWQPVPQSSESTRLLLDPEGTLHGTTSVVLRGQPKLDARRELRDADDAKKEQWVLALLQARHAQAELVGAPHMTGLQPNLRCHVRDDSMSIELEFEIRDFLVADIPALLPARFLAPPVTDPAPAQRETPIWRTYSRCSQHDVSIQLPGNVVISNAPDNFWVQGKHIDYRSTCSSEGSTLHFSRRVVTASTTVPPERLAQFHEEYGKIEAHEARGVTFAMNASTQR